jgi:hypothetical protein
MNGRQAIQATLESNRKLLETLVNDFSDADLLARPVPGANHAAWQIGNVIEADVLFIGEQMPEVVFPKLPEGFVALHGPEGTKKDEGFLSKDEYLKLLNEVRATVIAAVGSLPSDEALDKPTVGKFKDFAPTLGDVFLLLANHTMMHGGQFSVIRRKLGKPVIL